MAPLPTPPLFDAQTDLLPLFHREGCSFLIHSLATTLLAETKWGPVRRPHIKEPERRKKYAARDANDILKSLVSDELLLKATTWLSGADLLTTRLFPDGDESVGQSLPPGLYEKLVEAWRRHPGHADVPVYFIAPNANFIVERHRTACPRSEPLVAEQVTTWVRLSRIAAFPLGTWCWESATIEVPEEAVDGARHIALVRYHHLGRAGLICCPNVGYWHSAGSAAREADRQAVMSFLNARFEECRKAGSTFEVFGPGAIPRLKDRRARAEGREEPGHRTNRS